MLIPTVKKIFGLLILAQWALVPMVGIAQSEGHLSGGFSGNANWFIRDAKIGADNTPQYDHQLIGSESWLDLRYSQWGFDFGMRFDLFNNSNLLNPTSSYTDKGIGRWFAQKSIDKLTITGGYIYDQIGSGIIFRAYEERPLLIDNALYGVRLQYALNDNWNAKIFTGKQKFLFDEFDAVVKGGGIEGFLSLGSEESGFWSLAPGIGLVNRTLSDDQMSDVVNLIAGYREEDQFKPRYNVYMMTAYNTLSAGPITWYVEGAYKSDDIMYDPFEQRVTNSGGLANGKYVFKTGFVGYTSLSYAAKGLGITAEYKYTKDFDVRTDPLQSLNRALLSFIPPMTRLNTYRLTARYNAATQFVGEKAAQIDVKYSPNKKWSFGVNVSNIVNLDDDLLYRELYTEVVYKKDRKWQLTGGVQIQNYNQEVYEGKPEAPLVETFTPYGEFLYKFSRRKSLRLEAQYMSTEQDYGSWIFALAEFGMAPHWLFEVSGMYNIKPNPNNTVVSDPYFYPTFGVVYSHRASRFSLRYVKQVEGVVCSGGICRLEPAFSGVRFQVNTTF